MTVIRVAYVLMVEQSSIFVSILIGAFHNDKFTNSKFFLNEDNFGGDNSKRGYRL